jgi:archaeal flagellin N-terminal-like domain
MKKIYERMEPAVSPVIGVLLMLVVTIIIAAIVSGFAGGMAGGEKEAPQAAISAEILDRDDGLGNINKSIELKLMGGEPIQTKDLAILTYYTNSTGYIYKHEQTPTSDLIDTYAGTTYAGWGLTRVPYLSNLGKGWSNEKQQHFGNFTWMVGDVISTGTIGGTAGLLGIPDINDVDLKSGSMVDIKVKHIPSNKFIFDKEVIVR